MTFRRIAHLHFFSDQSALDAYRATLTNEFLGWVIFEHPASYVPVHRVRMDPTTGPVIIVGDEVYEVDPDTVEIFLTEDEARDVYWTRKK